MARNYKRDRKGRFAKVAGMKGSNPRSVKPAGTNKSRAVASHKAARAAVNRSKANRKSSGGTRSRAANIVLSTAAVTAGALVVAEADARMSGGGNPLKWSNGMLLAQRRRGAYNITTLR